MKKIIFRADGNAVTGLGHLYRIFAVIEMCKDDFDCLLLTRDDSSIKAIPSSYNVQLVPATVSIEGEADWICSSFPPSTYPIIIADGYQFNAPYQKKLKQLSYRLVYIDDMASQRMFADIVINHSPSASQANYQAEQYTQFALGPDFALVRPLFIEAARKPRVGGNPGTAFVCFGGSDPFALTEFTCKTLVNIDRIKKIHLVTGAAFRNETLLNLATQYSQIQIHKNLEEVELLKVMQESEFGIVPTSTILFELCCVKMPVIAGYYVDNQERAYFSFVDAQVISGIGNFKTTSAEELSSKVQAMLGSDTSGMIEKQSRLFDGQQKQRIIKMLTTLSDGY